jgi:two-component system chemotaxis sensor kinase CheA
MAQAGDLITASYGSEELVDRLARTGTRLLHEGAQRHRERETILSMLAGSPAAGQVAVLLDRADDRARATVVELDEILRLVSSHQKSLRTGASSFAEAARRARMVPFEQVTSGLPRLVRELAVELGKWADLEIVATDVEVDRELVILLREVLVHLVRNALDHGLEPPEDRVRAGKDERGRVRVAASLRSDGIQVVVSDDGRGVDEAGVRAAAERAGLSGDTRPDRSLAEAMFSPGVSTATKVSNVSGRGVGLDVVRTTVESTGGTVRVNSHRGVGTTLSLVLPLNLSTMRALLVRTAGQVVAIPSASVRRLTPVTAEGQQLAGGTVMTLDEEIVPVARLSDLLGWEPEATPTAVAQTGLVVATDAGVAVLTADDVVAEREVVLRASSSRISGVRKILGTTQLEDGSVVLVLNPPVCVRAAIFDRPAAPTARRREEAEPRTVLLVEDSLTTRELERSLLEAAGFTVLVAQDGQQGWDLLQTNEVDAVVSDVNMPRMDGIALCRSIRSSNRLQTLPVVLVTSLHSDADRRAGLDAGADAYLTKVGFNRDDLVEALERLL